MKLCVLAFRNNHEEEARDESQSCARSAPARGCALCGVGVGLALPWRANGPL